MDSSDDVSRVVPVYEGHALPHATQQLDIGGRDVTNRLCQLLGESGLTPVTDLEKEIVRGVKETHGYVALDFEAELKKNSSALEKTYGYPIDGVISVSSERFRCSEVLFQPSILGLHCVGIHEAVYKSINKCDVDMAVKVLYENIVLSGGTSMFPGLAERLKKEVAALAPPNREVKVIAPEDRKYSAWIGGSRLASLPTFPEMCVSRSEYEEHGTEIVHRKCF